MVLCLSRAGAFALGLATTLALLGVLSSAVGNAYGQIGNALPLGMTHLQHYKRMYGSKTGAGCYAHLHSGCIKLRICHLSFVRHHQHSIMSCQLCCALMKHELL